MIGSRVTRVVTAVLCTVVLASCGGSPETSVTAKRVTGPSIRLDDANDRIRTYILRLGDEVFAPMTVENEFTDDYPFGPPCPGVGKAAWTKFEVLNSEAAGAYPLTRNWLAANGFRLTERKAGGDRITDGKSADGFVVGLRLTTGGWLEMSFTTPCSWPASLPGGPTKPLPKVTPKTQQEARTPELACQKPDQYVLSPKPPAFRGAGPHPIAVVRILPENTDERGIYVPDAWDASVGDSGQIDKRRVQLLACVSGQPSEGSTPITCQYDEPEPKALRVPLYEATYDVVVFTASTGQRVGEFSVPGTETDEASCPAFFLHNTSTTLLRGIDIDAFQAKLRPLATARK